jgi:hypothetical protein
VAVGQGGDPVVDALVGWAVVVLGSGEVPVAGVEGAVVVAAQQDEVRQVGGPAG